MKVILPGVVAHNPFKIYTTALTQEMVDFWVMMGAEAQELSDTFHSRKGPVTAKNYRLRMGQGDWSHKLNDGSGTYLLHFRQEFAPEASLFIIKYLDTIINHSIKITENKL